MVSVPLVPAVFEVATLIVSNAPLLLLLKTTLPVSPALATLKFAPLKVEPLPLTNAVPLPAVPTFEESGVSGMVISHWWAVMAPAGVPKPVVEKLRGAIVQALGSRDLRERYAVLTVDAVTSTPDELRKLLETDVSRWRGIVKSAGIKLQ